MMSWAVFTLGQLNSNNDYITPLFRINQYFDGKRSDDEIMYLADITRKQLREVLQQYEEFVSGVKIRDREQWLTCICYSS